MLVAGISTLFAQEPGQYEPDPADLSRLYTFMETIARDSVEVQIRAYRQFVTDHPEQERACWHLLDFMVMGGQLEEARDFFQEQALVPAGRRNSLWMLARIYALEGNAAAALQTYREVFQNGAASFVLLDDFALFIVQNKLDLESEIAQLSISSAQQAMIRVEVLRRRGEVERVLTVLQETLPDYQTNKYLLHLAAYCHLNSGDEASALRLLEKGLGIARAENDRFMTAYYLTMMANVAGGNRGKAYWEEARKISEGLANLRLSINVYVASSFALEDKQAALGYMERAIEIATAIRSTPEIVSAWLLKAQLESDLENYNEALDAFVRTEQYLAQDGNEVHRYDFYLARGRFFHKLQLNQWARKDYETAYEWARQNGMLSYNYLALSRLADITLKEKEYERAIVLYRDFLNLHASKVRVSNRVYWRYKLAEAYQAQHKYAEAQQQFARVYQAADQIPFPVYKERMKAYALIQQVAILADQEDLKGASRLLNNDDLRQVSKDQQDVKIAYLMMQGRLYQQKEETDSAIVCLDEASRIIEAQRGQLKAEDLRVGFFSDKSKVYDELVSCYWQRYRHESQPEDLEQIYTALEMRRARVLRDLKFSGNKNLRRQSKDPLYQKYHAACNRLQALQRRIRLNPGLYSDLQLQLKTARQQVINTRLHLLNQYGSAAVEQQKPRLDELVSAMQLRQMSLLFYCIAENEAFVLVVNRGEPRVIALDAKLATIDSKVDSLLRPLHEMPPGGMVGIPFRAKLANELYQILIAPVKAQVDLEEQVMIIPDLALAGLPFDILLSQMPSREVYTPADPDTDYRDSFLLHQHAILYAPSSWVVRSASSAAVDSSAILLLANPFSNDLSRPSENALPVNRQLEYFEPLIYADYEAQMIKSRCEQVEVFQHQQATLKVIDSLGSRYGVHHYSTHSFIDNEFGAFSGLFFALSDDSTDDGLLTVYKIADLELNCDLVCLSACESGAGKLVRGEGVMGMPRQFLAAGARRVLMSQWLVSDRFSSLLMPLFYEGAIGERQPKAVALQQAKVGLLSQVSEEQLRYAHPFFWAGFTLYGEPEIALGPRFPLFSGNWWFVLLLGAIAGGYFVAIWRRMNGTPHSRDRRT